MDKKILIVDDDPLEQKLVKDICKIAGYGAVSACDGEEGISAALAHKPDLILMDVMMPKMDGYAAVRELKKKPETKNIPVIMVTAVGYKSNVELGIRAGASDYITKPFNIKQLILKMHQSLTHGVKGG